MSESASPVCRVGVVDDHPVALWGIEHLFQASPGVQVVGAADSLSALREVAGVGDHLEGIHVLLLDLYLGGSAPSLKTIEEAASQVPVLVMSASRSHRDVLAAVRAGAAGFVVKTADAGQFVEAVRRVADSGFFFSPELADIVQADLSGPGPKPALAPREVEVLTWVARGLTHQQIARQMRVAKPTVDTYVQRIRTKLGLGNKAQLTRAAIETFGLEAIVEDDASIG
jgi:two-component system nitrate/nitrite response regulator NarL